MAPTIIFFITLFVFICLTSSEKCVKAVDSFEQHLGTKAPYRTVANKNVSHVQFKGCRAVKSWGLVRHGTRNPNIKLMDRMKTRLPEIREQILENLQEATEYIHNLDLDLFRRWTTKLDDKDEKKLTHEGEDEMLYLAERLQSRFPELFSHVYSESAFKFKYTATQRTRKSAQYFAAGLFGKNTVKDIAFPVPLKQDPILRFYKLCKKWRKEVSNNPDAIIERTKFERSRVMSQMVKDVNVRLGFQNGELNLVDVHSMYMTCAFETAWNKRKQSPWCSPFTINDLEVLEYAEDLKYYWVDGYGHELTYRQACPAFNDLIKTFQSEGALPKATVYFTHSGTLLKMLAHLQLYKDDRHLTVDGFQKNRDRKWRVSHIDPFGANLFFLLFNCGGQQKVLTLHHEEIVRLPSCPEGDLCDLKKILQYYSSSVESCSFDEMCENDL